MMTKKIDEIEMLIMGILSFSIIEILLRTLLELHFDFVFSGIFLIILYFVGFVILIHAEIIRQRRLLYFFLLFSLIFVSLFYNELSEDILLGRPVASTGIAEAPGGAVDLFIYKNDRCKLTYQGLFNSETFYGTYHIYADTILIKTKGDLLELNNRILEMNGLSYKILQK